MKKIVFIILAAAVIIVALVFFYGKISAPDMEYDTLDIVAPNAIIHALLADTEAKLELGLSGRTTLARDSGMMFRFETPGIYGFWMKDMKMPIDIVWVDEEKTVLGVLSNLAPETYPNTYNPPANISYALELSAGAAKEMGVATGTVLDF